MKLPAPLDLTLYRGDDFEHKLVFTDDSTPPQPLDLRDYTFQAQVRDRPEYGTVVYAQFQIGTENADIGVLWLRLPAGSTSFPPGYWDLQVDDGSKKNYLVKR